MRKIDEIIWHCTATLEGRAVTVNEVRRWHLERGWSDIGYHFLVGINGEVWEGRPLAIAGAHVRGRNARSIGVAYVGGIDADGRPKDTRTAAQRAALYRLTGELIERFGLEARAAVRGHNEFAAKACPCFNAPADWLDWLDGAPLSVAHARAHDEAARRPQFRTADADPVAEAARKPSAQAAGGATTVVTAGASAASALAGAPWQALAVLGVVLVALAVIFREPVLRRLGRG